MTTINISVLGEFKIEYNGNVISDDINRSKKMWNILAFIVINRKNTITQARFIDTLWTEDESNNPVNALKTQLFRTREMLKPLGLKGDSCILSHRGAYSWNPKYLVNIDFEIFENLIQAGNNTGLSGDERIKNYINALALYKGDFIPKLSGEVWTIPISAKLHSLYLSTVKSLCTLLEIKSDYETIISILIKAIEIDNLDESLHCLLINAYIKCDRYNDALKHYDSATSLLYKNLGIEPSDELRSLYNLIMDTQKSLETDLSIIQENLTESSLNKGAFFCEYGYFVKSYQLTQRRLTRLGLSTYLCLITIQGQNDSLSLKSLDNYMSKLLDTLKSSLRTGDVVSRYSTSQYIILLPCVSFENADMVMNRILSNYKKRFRHDKAVMIYKIKEI